MVFLPEQRLVLGTALVAYTSGSARVNHLDDTGMIRVGSLAAGAPRAGGLTGVPHDFLLAPQLARPQVTAELAAAVAAEHFGVDGSVRELGSQQDRNFEVRSPRGRFVLKVANPAFSDLELTAQDAALAHLAARAPDLVVPRSAPARDGSTVARFKGPDGPLRARLLTFVEGVPLAQHRHLAPVVVAALGDLAGAVAAALADLQAPGLVRGLQWDVRRAREVCTLLAPHLPDAGRRTSLLEAVGSASDRLDTLAPGLRVQPVHGDVTDDNVVCGRGPDGRPVPQGVIDFGDVGLGWVVGDLAATVASVLHHDPQRPLTVLPAIRAYAARLPLTDEEIQALWPAVVARAAVLVASGVHQGVIDPGNDYAIEAQDREWRMLAAAVALPVEVATAAIRDALGRPVQRTQVGGVSLLPRLPADLLDLSVTTEAMHDGSWLEPGAEQQAAASRVTVTRWGEARITRTRLYSRLAPATVALGVDVSCPDGTPVSAPFAGLLRVVDAGWVLTGNGLELHMSGLEAVPTDVAEGSPLGLVSGGRLTVQLCTVPGLLPPAFARPEEAAAWQAVCPDPSPLLGLDVDLARPEPVSPEELLARRHRAFADVQEYYYAAPPRIERGWRHHLFDTSARSYLDAVNNVASVGHAHPRVTHAAARQWDLLNTNSRFHYATVADFSERLAALLPDQLDTVFLVNSGSEAVDLALRLAQSFTGRPDVLCLAEAYHGWTTASDAISTSVADNPQALSTRPDWVHPLPAPNPYRGLFRGPDAGDAYLEQACGEVARMVAAGRPPGAFICEAVYGNAGGIALPDGYLSMLYRTVRAAGGLCVADEVQVGYGRLGSSFWGFEQQGVVPDLVTVAKAMGNGHPLGAVITRRDVAEEFRRNGYFFSSAGGSPVSCAIGMAVLDVIEQECLQERAAVVGAHLRRRFEDLALEVELIGAVHGLGLYVGVELVRDRVTLEPATEETAAICERLLELGVVLQATGDRLNVLKVKPPMCLTVEGADFFVDRVAEVLLCGW